MAAMASDRPSGGAMRSLCQIGAFCAKLAHFCIALSLFSFSGAASAQQATSGWSTTVEPAPRRAEPAPRGGYDTELPLTLEREGVTLSIENDLGGAPKRGASRYLVLRRGLAPEAEGGPYVGAGFGLETDYGADDEEVTGKLVGGVAAPLSDKMQLYGEYQHQRSLQHSDADDRFQFGLRRKF